MINGMSVENFNAREKRRASIVAKLHDYIPFGEGDTEESLKAQYLAADRRSLPQPRGRASRQCAGSQGSAAAAD